MEDFLLFFAYAAFMFQGAPDPLRVVIRCKGCGENIPAPVEGMPTQPIAATCPLCDKQRRYLPSQVFQGPSIVAVIAETRREGVLMQPPATRHEKDGRVLVIAAAIIAGLRLERDPRAGHKSERVIYAVEDAVFLANEIYDLALLRFGGNLEYEWENHGFCALEPHV